MWVALRGPKKGKEKPMSRIPVEYRLTIYPYGKDGPNTYTRTLRTTTIQGIGMATEFATRHLAAVAPIRGMAARAKLVKVFTAESNPTEYPVAAWFGAQDGKSWYLNDGSLDWAHSIEVTA